MSQSITRIGIDLAKNIFQVCGASKTGDIQFNKRLKRSELAEFIVNIPACEVVLEACAGSHYWSRVFRPMGHEVKVIHPAFVRPYVKTNKNDATDAAALCEAASRPHMRFVQTKTIEQQDIQMLHRIRERLVNQRTALSNQIRGFLGEYGLILPVGIRNVRKELPSILEDGENELTVLGRRSFQRLYDELCVLEERVTDVKQEIEQLSIEMAQCQRLTSVPGVGPMVATALYATMGDPKNYRNGREFSAFLGLVPKQYSTGGKTILKGISKRGDPHMRRLLIQGAQAALRVMPKRDDRLSQWACKLKAAKGNSVAVVALANKLARICWALADQDTTYQASTS